MTTTKQAPHHASYAAMRARVDAKIAEEGPRRCRAARRVVAGAAVRARAHRREPAVVPDVRGRSGATVIGANCNAHVATTILRVGTAGRAPVLCRRWVPSFARTCPECGSISPAVRIENFVRYTSARGVQGDLAKAIDRSAHRRPS